MYVYLRCMCKYLSRRNSNHSSSVAQKPPSLNFKYLALFSTTHICQTSAKQREREKKNDISFHGSARRQLKSHTRGNKLFKVSCQKSVTTETNIPVLTVGYCTSPKHSCCNQFDEDGLLHQAVNSSHACFHIVHPVY